MVKNLPARQDTQVLSLGQDDPLEKEMATHSSILAWRIPWTEDPGGLQSKVLQRVRPNQACRHRMYDTESEPCYKLWILGDGNESVQVTNVPVTNVPFWWEC